MGLHRNAGCARFAGMALALAALRSRIDHVNAARRRR
jgi:hypothetical protein